MNRGLTSFAIDETLLLGFEWKACLTTTDQVVEQEQGTAWEKSGAEEAIRKSIGLLP